MTSQKVSSVLNKGEVVTLNDFFLLIAKSVKKRTKEIHVFIWISKFGLGRVINVKNLKVEMQTVALCRPIFEGGH